MGTRMPGVELGCLGVELGFAECTSRRDFGLIRAHLGSLGVELGFAGFCETAHALVVAQIHGFSRAVANANGLARPLQYECSWLRDVLATAFNE
jgi:hypothetical protein